MRWPRTRWPWSSNRANEDGSWTGLSEPGATGVKQPLQKTGWRSIGGFGFAIGVARQARVQAPARLVHGFVVDLARAPPGLRDVEIGREVDGLQAVRDRILDRFGDRGGHDAVSRPFGVEARVVQIEAVARHETNPHGHDLRAHHELKNTQGAALGQPFADLV